MSQPLATAAQIDDALRRLGHYRVRRAQEVALEPDGIGGHHLLAMGLRETWGRNIEGGAKLENGVWVPETDPAKMDVGFIQISRRWHGNALRQMPAVKAKTWEPIIEGKTPMDAGYVPTFTHAIRFTVPAMQDAIAYARSNGYTTELVRFAIAAHNAGKGGALSGRRSGNVDRDTAGGDYSAWVLDASKKIEAWIRAHPNWRWTP